MYALDGQTLAAQDTSHMVILEWLRIQQEQRNMYPGQVDSHNDHDDIPKDGRLFDVADVVDSHQRQPQPSVHLTSSVLVCQPHHHTSWRLAQPVTLLGQGSVG